jgi:hypothetical protein
LGRHGADLPYHPERIVQGKKTVKTVYAITSLSAERASPGQRLVLNRAHWGGENCLHSVRDVTGRVDQAGANAGHASLVLAAFRNTALTVRRRLDSKGVEGLEYFDEYRLTAARVARG